MMEWMPPPDGIAMCQGGDVCRIPRHLGDAVEESDGDLMGEGVNMAARLAEQDEGCRPPAPHVSLSGGSALLVVADAAAQIADPGHQAHLRDWRLISAWPRKHVADLGYLTFRLLVPHVEFGAKGLPVGSLFNLVSTPSNCLALGLPRATDGLPVADGVDAPS
jgi:hypothetical protein